MGESFLDRLEKAVIKLEHSDNRLEKSVDRIQYTAKGVESILLTAQQLKFIDNFGEAIG